MLICLIEKYFFDELFLLIIIDKFKLNTMKYIILLIIAASAAFTVSAQSTKNSSKAKVTDTLSAKWICPMDTDVVSNKPGKCPKCGMELIKAKIYTCSMHPEVHSDKPGKCPKCSMDLVEVKDKSEAKKD